MSAKILVVDDEPDFVEFVSFNLKEHGFTVATAGDGLEALFQARRFLPDVVVLDVMMDGIDGYSVCEMFRRQAATKRTSIIMVTAATGQIARLNGLAAGADDFLPKPFSARELLRRVDKLLEQRARGKPPQIAADQGDLPG